MIRAFGILNEADYPPGDFAHSVPYPGTFVTDENAIVRSKRFDKTYMERRTAASFLTLAGDTPAASASAATTSTFTLRTSSSNAQAAPGQHVTLVLDFEMKPRMHAYAPGVRGYRPLGLILDPEPLMNAHQAVFPPSRPYHFAPLNETVPVLADRFRVTQDVTLAGGREFTAFLKAADPTLAITGTLQYQVCSDTICHAPATLPLRWAIKVLPLDRERAPEAIQHKPAKQ